jgi:hypothetical protein
MVKLLGILAFAVLSLASATGGQSDQQMVDKCSSYGFRPGTQGYANCMMQMDQQNSANVQRVQQCRAATGDYWNSPAFNKCMAGFR